MGESLISDRLVPFRWLAAWTDPALLRLFSNGPINCFLFDRLASARGIVDAARAKGMETMEWAALGAAPFDQVKWNISAPQVAITGLVWPQLKPPARGDADAGPTGAPWIDSNTWVKRLAAARAPRRAIWLGFERPKDDATPAAAAYTTAIADSAAAGARWMVILDDKRQEGVATGDPEALRTWDAIIAALRFFQTHRSWNAWPRSGPVGVMSDFAGNNEFMGQEFLNLAARRKLLYRVLSRSDGNPSLEGLLAVLYLDREPPTAALQSRLLAFARSGGLVIVPRAVAASFGGGRPISCPVAGYEWRPLGQGAIAAATLDRDDPYFLAADVHNLIRRRSDPFTLFNAASLWEHYSVAPDGRAAVLQLVGFASRPYGSVSVAMAHSWRSATLYVIGSVLPTHLQPALVEGRLELHLPPFSNYAALEFHS